MEYCQNIGFTQKSHLTNVHIQMYVILRLVKMLKCVCQF